MEVNWGQYFFVNSSLSSSSPPNGELKNTRAVLRCCFKLAFERESWRWDNLEALDSVITRYIYVSTDLVYLGFFNTFKLWKYDQ